MTPFQSSVFSGVKLGRQMPDKAFRQLVLDGKNIRQIPVVPLAPELRACLRVRQLRRNPDAVAR